MDGSASTGSPGSAGSLRHPARSLRHPALADGDTLHMADWISAPEEDDRRSRASVSPAETQLTIKKPDHLGLYEHTNHKGPLTEQTIPEDSPTKPAQLDVNISTEQQRLRDPPSPKDQPEPVKPEPLKLHPHERKPEEQNPVDCQESKTQEDLYLTDQKPVDAPPPHLNPKQVPPPLHLNTQQAPPPHLNPQQPPPPHLNTQQAPPHLNPQQVPPPLHLNIQQAPPSHLNTQQVPPPPPPPPPHLNIQQPPPPHLNPQQPPPPHLNIQQAPPPHLNIQQAPHPHLNTQQAPHPHLNIQQAPHPHLNTQQAPPPHLNIQQAPHPHLNTQQASPHLNTQQAPPHLNPQQPPPPPHLNPQQAPPHLNTQQAPPHLNPQQAPPPHLNPQQPPPPHLNPQQPPHLNPQQAPPPHLNPQQAPLPHLNPQQAPLPHLNPQPQSSPQVLPLIICSTEESNWAPLVQDPPVLAPLVQDLPVLAPLVQAPLIQDPLVLAPPLTIEVFCDQVTPRPLVSSSGDPKLCGFLQKQGGPLRAWKQRWFTYEEKKNQLFYYRTPHDVMPLGRVELCSATFTYPLKAEQGTFHIKTPERTFILKAVTQELMLYWLQQLQVNRWQHRQTSAGPDHNSKTTSAGPDHNSKTTEDFLPVLRTPLGLVGAEAASVASPQTPLANMSIKHPLIEIQNSVHSLRKRASQEWSPSVFHVDAPTWTPRRSVETSTTMTPSTSIEPPTPPPPLSLAEPAGQVFLAKSRDLPSLFDSWSRKTKSRSASTMTILRRDTASSDQTSRLQQEKQMLMEEVKAQKELVWILHKALEASQLEKRTCAEFLAEKGEQERLELLRHRERLAADLREQLEDAKTEAEARTRTLAQRDRELAELQESIGMLMEKNNAKQEVIIKLSDQVTACMSSGRGLDSQTFRQLQQEIENLKDDIEAYKTQNKFLNSEIYQLTKLWRTSSKQEKSLMVKCAYLEASNCQVESRYLGVLRQLQETKSLDPVQRGAVQKMIEDALKGALKSALKLNVARDHDEYGFKIIPDYEVEDMKLLAKIQALEIRSHNLLHQEAGERPLLSRWAQYLAGRSDVDLCPSPELKGLLRGGIPQEYRQRVWRWVVRARTRTIRDCHPQRYQQLCEKSRTCPHPASRQIQLDLHRTLTTNQYFGSPSSPALQQLHHILLAFSWQNPVIGYCQGLNRLAAIALLVLQSEEDAFWCLVAVVEDIMPQDYYTKNLVASQADQRVLKDFLAEKLPRLASHFEDHSIDVSLITFNWFLVVFVESLPSDLLLPLWDAFLYEGTKVIFRYTLALFKYKEDDILKIHDSVEIYQYLRFFAKTISDGRKLTSIAFGDLNPFPGRLLRNRRAVHLERLQGELKELEEQQREFFITESTTREHKELEGLVSEEEEEEEEV